MGDLEVTPNALRRQAQHLEPAGRLGEDIHHDLVIQYLRTYRTLGSDDMSVSWRNTTIPIHNNGTLFMRGLSTLLGLDGDNTALTADSYDGTEETNGSLVAGHNNGTVHH